MNLTEQQRAAVTTEGRALLVEAGAGTGKTAVLVARFLHLLDQHPAWPLESIVAVTFTEKATREMRSRIRTAVETSAAVAAPDSHWPVRRRDLDRLAVSTIHGLCARILAENPIAAKLDPRFIVLEDQDAAALREQAVRQALADLAVGAPTTGEDLNPLDLLTQFETRDLHEQMLRLLGQRGTVERLFARLGDARALVENWRIRIAEMQRTIWQEQLARDAGIACALDALAGLLVTHPEDKLAEHVRKAQEGCRLAAAGDLCGAALCFKSIKINAGAAAAWGGKDGLIELKEWLKQARSLGACLVDPGYDKPIGAEDEAAADALQSWRALWIFVTAVYDGLKVERHALDFDDLERLAARLLRAQPRDDRVQATVTGINHLMVDEFQDVNEAQGEILYALADPGEGGRFFAVGDAKQSIYRFRQAQVKILNTAARDILRWTGHGPLPLSRSFRTHSALLAALNDAFDAVLQPLGDEHAEFEARPGALEPERTAPPPHSAAPAPVEVIVLPEGLSGNVRRLEAAVLSQRLIELCASGFPVLDRRTQVMRPIVFGDIAILFRATTSLPLYEDVFKSAGLPYVTVSGRGYYDRPEVSDLTALLACLYNPADDLSLAMALRSPMFSLSDETLYRLRWFPAGGGLTDEPIALADALAAPPASDQPGEVAAAARTLSALWGMAGREDVWTLLRTALDRTGYEATLALADATARKNGSAAGGRTRANIAKFLQLARDRGGADLSVFLQSVQDLHAREVREGEAMPDPTEGPDAGAVQLMSVHAAKGLEFPVVVVADLGRAARGGNAPRILHDPAFGLACQVRDGNGDWVMPAGYRFAAWLDGRMERAESHRLLYVACTRAADLLILSGQPSGKECWLAALSSAWELDLAGEGERVVERTGYRIRVTWPIAPEEGEPASFESESVTRAMLTPVSQVPPLARPLPVFDRRRPIAVTHLDDLHDANGLPKIRPVLRSDANGRPAGRPRHFLVGNLAHRALADWECLELPPLELESVLIRWARRGGLIEPADVARAVQRVAQMLDGLRHTKLYGGICAASERHFEIPLSIRAGDQVLHGILDLLYRDARGMWRLLDWKTEPVRRAETLQTAAQPYLIQMAVYRRAIEEILGIQAEVEICFLAPWVEVYRPPVEELAHLWDTLL